MVSRHCLADDVQRTPCKKSTFVRLGSVNPRAADALHGDDGWMAFDMVTVEQQFRLEMPPPRLNLTKACNAFLKSVAPHASVGCAAMDYEINRQMLLVEAQKFPGGCNGQDDGWDNDDDVGTVGTLTTTEAGEISEDDDDEDEDHVCPVMRTKLMLQERTLLHMKHTCSSTLRRIVRSTVMASQRWELSMMPRMTMPLTSIS